MTYTIHIFADEDKPRLYKVAICHGSEVIGVPLRGATKLQAEEMIEPLKYAFDYGARAAIQHFQHMNVNLDIEETERS